MSLSESDIDIFIDLFNKTFQKKLSRLEAQEKAIALLTVVKITYKPMTRQEHQKYYCTLKN